ncbi:hypothetical protein WA577_007537, partial [Blastocystis sp. JDR]
MYPESANNDDCSSMRSEKEEMRVSFRKNKRPESSSRPSLSDSLHSSPIKHTKEEEDIFSPNLHVSSNLRDSVRSHPSESMMQDGTIENVSSFIRKSYREEENAVIDEESIFDAAIEDKQTVAAVSSHNRMEQINDPAQQKTDRIIYAAEVENEVDDSEFNPVIIIKTLPPYHTLPALYRQKRILPPKREGTPEYTLVLDLDETLVHCTMERNPSADLVFPIFYENHRFDVFANIRPFFFYLLKRIAPHYEIIIFTASQQCYADRILDILDADQHLISYRLYRDDCLLINGNYVKDLNVLNRDLAKTVIVDNSISCFGYNIENGIPIISWFDDKSDHELYNLSTVLLSFLKKDDVRPSIEKLFHLRQLLDSFEVIV